MKKILYTLTLIFLFSISCNDLIPKKEVSFQVVERNGRLTVCKPENHSVETQIKNAEALFYKKADSMNRPSKLIVLPASYPTRLK